VRAGGATLLKRTIGPGGFPLSPPGIGQDGVARTGLVWIGLVRIVLVVTMLGGAVPVPNGLGVIEAGLIAGFTAAGVPQSEAVADVFIERICTAYVPPIYGWATLAFMRRREYI
jgi:uncharacterized membrane protein YbhN (UPF0104 family)